MNLLAKTSSLPSNLRCIGRGAPAEDGVALAGDPVLIVPVDARAGGGLEDGQAAGEGDVDEDGAGMRRQAGVEEVAELVGVLGGEGVKGEGVAGGGEVLQLFGREGDLGGLRGFAACHEGSFQAVADWVETMKYLS